jgi:hypothetical protein
MDCSYEENSADRFAPGIATPPRAAEAHRPTAGGEAEHVEAAVRIAETLAEELGGAKAAYEVAANSPGRTF